MFQGKLVADILTITEQLDGHFTYGSEEQVEKDLKDLNELMSEYKPEEIPAEPEVSAEPEKKDTGECKDDAPKEHSDRPADKEHDGV